MFLSTKEFFAMLARHMCSGRPVLADCWWTKSSGDCVPSPIGSVPCSYRSAALPSIAINSRQEIGSSASRARCACRMSRLMIPPPAWLTLAIGSPVAK